MHPYCMTDSCKHAIRTHLRILHTVWTYIIGIFWKMEEHNDDKYFEYVKDFHETDMEWLKLQEGT